MGTLRFIFAITSKTVPVLASTKNSNRSCISFNIVVRPCDKLHMRHHIFQMSRTICTQEPVISPL